MQFMAQLKNLLRLLKTKKRKTSFKINERGFLLIIDHFNRKVRKDFTQGTLTYLSQSHKAAKFIFLCGFATLRD